jgi:hypothetical protein
MVTIYGFQNYLRNHFFIETNQLENIMSEAHIETYDLQMLAAHEHHDAPRVVEIVKSMMTDLVRSYCAGNPNILDMYVAGSATVSGDDMKLNRDFEVSFLVDDNHAPGQLLDGVKCKKSLKISAEMEDRIVNGTYEIGEFMGLPGSGTPETTFLVRHLHTMRESEITIPAYGDISKTAKAIVDRVRSMGQEYILLKSIDPSRTDTGPALLPDGNKDPEENGDYALSPFHQSAYVAIGNIQIHMRRDENGTVKLIASPQKCDALVPSDIVLFDEVIQPEQVHKQLMDEEAEWGATSAIQP